MELPIENKVEKANIKQIDLSDYLTREVIFDFDMKNGLWQEMIIKEKEFRAFIKTFDWSQYENKIVSVYCSVDAIIPAWAFMLVSTQLNTVGAKVYSGNIEATKSAIFFENLNQIDTNTLTNQRVMVKGCSDIPDPTKAYIILTNLLVPKVKSLMFGEPCSAVPVFKRR